MSRVDSKHADYQMMHQAMLRNTNSPKVLVPFVFNGIRWKPIMSGGSELVFVAENPQPRPSMVDAAYESSIRVPGVSTKPLVDPAPEVEESAAEAVEEEVKSEPKAKASKKSSKGE